MGAIWFRVPLTCPHCGSSVGERETRLHTSGFAGEATDGDALPGEVLDLSLDDFADGYFTLRHPVDDADVRALEQWGCPVCGRAQWARLDFRREDAQHHRFVGAHAVPLRPETLRDVHFVSRWMDLWIESNPGAETDWLRPLIEPLLP